MPGMEMVNITSTHVALGRTCFKTPSTSMKPGKITSKGCAQEEEESMGLALYFLSNVLN